MDFNKLVVEVNNANVEGKNVFNGIVKNIDINEHNFGLWIDKIFSENIDNFDMQKLPYLIEELYKSNDKFKFMLCCMLIEATCEKLEFITNLENIIIFKGKFEILLNTLLTVYDRVDNGIANCMALILINSDSKFKLLNLEQKDILVSATKRKLEAIMNYLNNKDIDNMIYDDLGIIVDLACYLNNSDISEIISKIDDLGCNEDADLFIIKYKIINNLSLNEDKINKYSKDSDKLFKLYSIMENLGVQDRYLKDVSQEVLAMVDMKRWLRYPTELGSFPDTIDLLGEIVFNKKKIYAFKFKKIGFKIEGELLGISGGYPLDKVSAIASGYTFSKFENVKNDWAKQAMDLANFIYDCWGKKGLKNK